MRKTNEMMNLSRRALVTGASEGIGRAFCARLARDGYEILAVARNEERLKSLVADLPGVGHSCLVADLSTREGRAKVRDAIAGGAFEVLINNAGFGKLGRFTESEVEEWDRMIELNVVAPVELSHAFLSKAGSGSILINVSSTLSFLPMPVQGVYSATKAFVTSFTESLWFEGRQKGIRVLNLCPGITATEFNLRSGGKPGELPRFLTETPEEVVEAAWQSVLKNRTPTKISGWKNRVGAMMARLLSRKRLILTMGNARQ